MPATPAPSDSRRSAAGRHRRQAPPGPGVALDVISRLGSAVALAALLVVAGAVGGLSDGVPATGEAAVVTLDGTAR